MISEDEFVNNLRGLLETSRDPALHDAIWSYREGKIDRLDLLGHPAYQRHMGEAWDAAVEEFERAGGSLADIRAETRRIAEELGLEELVAEEGDEPLA